MAKILVVNLGPGAVKVETQGRKPNGEYKAIAETKMKGGSSRKFIVEHGQSLQVIDPTEK